MTEQQNTGKPDHAIILEADKGLASQIEEYLKNQGYAVFAPLSSEAALDLLKGQRIQLAFLGNPPEGGSCFDLIKDFVMTSPMTYVILVTDAPEKEIHDRAEGYGILGHVPRAFSPVEIQKLIAKYQEINQALRG
ncbi:MAG: hypothetical protein DRH15_14980 [Deltaproteobacteria bacterium]|nr:MAG: hypothetical protein DRH15_14980 [Deltaproteobacteria bacterium]